ncbi:hypothetical protein [Streptosporangium sp. NPDC051022]|uniref:hypothetical protein n=1 Tax=Streptosporangium sp. NPDC051022 TaxID=3155752 RepID=UPI0034199DD9
MAAEESSGGQSDFGWLWEKILLPISIPYWAYSGVREFTEGDSGWCYAYGLFLLAMACLGLWVWTTATWAAVRKWWRSAR